MSDFKQIVELFNNEFSSLKDEFCLFNLSVKEASESKLDYIWHPGVYIWWHPDKGVVRVGRHLINSRKRALEHISYNTGGIIKELSEDNKTRVFLFNIKNIEKIHWVAALEIYFELKLEPSVKAGRLG